MSGKTQFASSPRPSPPLRGREGAVSSRKTGRHSDLLILADGRILAHNLTPVMARVLAELMPDDPDMRLRVAAKK